MIINGKECEFTNERNILEVIRKNGFNVPTFCYRPDLTKDFGACRMCVVEIDGRMIQASCTTPPAEGMVVKTNTEKVRSIRKSILKLLLANHDRECTTCDKSGTCELQKYSEEYGIKDSDVKKFVQRKELLPIDDSAHTLVRDPNKCILCGACVRACEEHQEIAVLGFTNRGSRTVIQPMVGKDLAHSECIGCGQCAAVCPTGAITVKREIGKVWNAIHDENKRVVFQIAPQHRHLAIQLLVGGGQHIHFHPDGFQLSIPAAQGLAHFLCLAVELVQVLMGLLQNEGCGFIILLRLFGSGGELFQGIQPDGHFHALQFVLQVQILSGLFRLDLQGFQLQLQFGNLVADAQQVVLCMLELAFRFLLAVAVLGDTRRFLKDLPAVSAF